MNNINGRNKTKQQAQSEFNFHHVKKFVVSPKIHGSIRLGENLQFNFQTLRELRSLHRNQALLRFTQSGFQALSMIKCCLQPTQMLPSTDSIQFSFQQVPDFCNIFSRSWQGFLHNNFEMQKFRFQHNPLYHYQYYPALYIHGMSLDFQTAPLFWVFLRWECLQFWHARYHIFWCIFLYVSVL